MRDHTTDRAARELPPDYQFGDARWRRPSENAGEQLRRRADLEPSVRELPAPCAWCGLDTRRLPEAWIWTDGTTVFCSHEHMHRHESARIEG